MLARDSRRVIFSGEGQWVSNCPTQAPFRVLMVVQKREGYRVLHCVVECEPPDLPIKLLDSHTNRISMRVLEVGPF